MAESKFTKGLTRTVGGRDAEIFSTSGRGTHPILGVVHYESADEPASWTEAGKFLINNKDTMTDILGSRLAKDCDE